jgi:predicted phosphate transport protein (TIGR00153 family)
VSARIAESFVPRERAVFDQLEQAAANVARATDLLDEMVHSYPEHRELAREILLCEQQGDRITEAVVTQVNQTFVTPIEREDLLALVSALDDVVDFAEEVADYMGLYGIEQPRREARQMTQILLAAGRQIDRAVPRLRRMDDTSAEVAEIHRSEREGDRIVRQAIAALFREESDATLLIRWKDLFERLEAAIDATEAVADALTTIRLKNG